MNTHFGYGVGQVILQDKRYFLLAATTGVERPIVILKNIPGHSSPISRPLASCGKFVKGVNSTEDQNKIDSCTTLDKLGATATFGVRG
jgi:hypothetical protein